MTSHHIYRELTGYVFHVIYMQLQTVAAMSHYYQQKRHYYVTRCSDHFANPFDYHLSRTMNFFCQVLYSTWWNDGNSKISFPPTMTHPELVNGV